MTSILFPTRACFLINVCFRPGFRDFVGTYLEVDPKGTGQWTQASFEQDDLDWELMLITVAELDVDSTEMSGEKRHTLPMESLYLRPLILQFSSDSEPE